MDKYIKYFKYLPTKKQITIELKVKAGAKRNCIDKLIIIDEQQYLKLFIKAIPEQGKANKMIINFLSKEWKIPKSNLEIIQGSSSNYKVLLLKNIEPAYLLQYLK